MMQLMLNKNHCRLASSGGVFQKKMPPLNGEIWILSPKSVVQSVSRCRIPEFSYLCTCLSAGLLSRITLVLI